MDARLLRSRGALGPLKDCMREWGSEGATAQKAHMRCKDHESQRFAWVVCFLVSALNDFATVTYCKLPCLLFCLTAVHAC